MIAFRQHVTVRYYKLSRYQNASIFFFPILLVGPLAYVRRKYMLQVRVRVTNPNKARNQEYIVIA